MVSQQELLRLQEEIKDLPKEQQQAKINEFLKRLPKEELEKLQQKQCPFCLIAEGKIKAKTIYEDDIVMAVLDINPANLGHVILFPKKHCLLITELEDDEVAYLFKVVSKISRALDGDFNIFLANGALAGQTNPHLIVHIIPRYKDDEINLGWNAKKIEEKEMDRIVNKIRSKIKKEEIKIEEPKVEKGDYEEKERIP
jgi:histidine triad (HIT) family protein